MPNLLADRRQPCALMAISLARAVCSWAGCRACANPPDGRAATVTGPTAVTRAARMATRQLPTLRRTSGKASSPDLALKLNFLTSDRVRLAERGIRAFTA
jgi:hypothetical protein